MSDRARRSLPTVSLLLALALAACGGGGGGGGGGDGPSGAPRSLVPLGAPGGLPAGDVVAPATLVLDGSGLSAPDGLVLAGLRWDWGDGTAADETGPTGAPTHVYPAAGRFTIGVTATYDDGSSGSRTFAVSVVSACGVVTTFEDGKTPTLEIHVDVEDGRDDTGGGSAAAPYATIGRGARDLVPGAALRIHAGVYPGGTSLEDLAGTESAPIWIGGAPGEAAPVIRGGAEGLHLTRVRWLVLHDIEVEDSAQNGINCDDGGDTADPDATRHVIFRNLEIHDVGSGGNQDLLKLSGVDDYVVRDSVFRDGSAGGSGIDHVGCHAGRIVRCSFERMGSNGVQCKGGSEDLEIRWCVFREAGARGVNVGGSTGNVYFRPPLSTTEPNFEARDVRLLGNVFHGGEAAFAFVGAVDCVAAHNTILTPHRWLFRILQEHVSDGTYVFLETRDCEVTNNLWHFDRADLAPIEYVNVGPNTRPETYVYRHNLWYAYDDPSASQPPQITGETGGITGADPRLVDPAAGDVSLEPSSPARGAGASQTWLGAGIGGGCFTDPPNVGAHE